MAEKKYTWEELMLNEVKKHPNLIEDLAAAGPSIIDELVEAGYDMSNIFKPYSELTPIDDKTGQVFYLDSLAPGTGKPAIPKYHEIYTDIKIRFEILDL